jgi:hypothetical protein
MSIAAVNPPFQPVNASARSRRWVQTIQDRAVDFIQALTNHRPAELHYQTPASAWPADAAGGQRSAVSLSAGASPDRSRRGPAGRSASTDGDVARSPERCGRGHQGAAERGRYRTELVVTTTCTGDAQEDVSSEVEAVLGMPVEIERTSEGHFIVRSVWEAATPPDVVFADLAMRSVLSGVMCNATGEASAEVRVVSYDREAIRGPWKGGNRAPKPVFERQVGQASRRSRSAAVTC